MMYVESNRCSISTVFSDPLSNQCLQLSHVFEYIHLQACRAQLGLVHCIAVRSIAHAPTLGRGLIVIIVVSRPAINPVFTNFPCRKAFSNDDIRGELASNLREWSLEYQIATRRTASDTSSSNGQRCVAQNDCKAAQRVIAVNGRPPIRGSTFRKPLTYHESANLLWVRFLQHVAPGAKPWPLEGPVRD